MITVIQNFICTKSERLSVLKTDLPGIAAYFKDYEFIVNYNSNVNYTEVKELYEANISKLKFSHNLEKDWGKTTLELVEQATTDYVFIMPEDFMCMHKSSEYFRDTFNEAIQHDVDYFLMHRIAVYTDKKYISRYKSNELTYECNWSTYPGQCLSSVAIFKKAYIINVLKHYISGNRKNHFSIATPNNFEVFYRRGQKGWDVPKVCMIPKQVIVQHNEPYGKQR